MEKGLLIECISELIRNILGCTEVILVMWGIMACNLSHKKIRWCLSLICLFAGSFVNSILFDEKISIFFSIGITLLSVIICFEEKWLKKILIYLFVYFGLDIFYEIVLLALNVIKIPNLRWGELQLFQIIESLTVICLCIVLLRFIRKKTEYLEWIHSVNNTFYLTELLSMLSISALNSLIRYWSYNFNSIEASVIDFLRLTLTISLFILCFLLAKVDFHRFVYKNDNLYKDEILKLSKEHYQSLERQIKETRRIRHDMNSQYSALDALISKKDWENAREYLNTIREHQIQSYLPNTNIGNELVDAVILDISSKYPDIKINIVGSIEKTVVKDYDLCIIFSNLIKNALEAESNIASEKKEVSIEIKHYENILMINIKNKIEIPSVININKLGEYTTKDNSELHGYGIYNVRKVIESYSGNLDFSIEDKIFVAKIMIMEGGS